MLFASTIVTGQLVVALGAQWKSYGLILFGRLVIAYALSHNFRAFSLGGENISVAISGFLYYWYKGKRLGTPMALVTIASLLSSSACYLLTPIIYNINHELALPMWLAFLFCVVAFGCGLLVRYLTIYGEEHGLVNVLFARMKPCGIETRRT